MPHLSLLSDLLHLVLEQRLLLDLLLSQHLVLHLDGDVWDGHGDRARQAEHDVLKDDNEGQTSSSHVPELLVEVVRVLVRRSVAIRLVVAQFRPARAVLGAHLVRVLRRVERRKTAFDVSHQVVAVRILVHVHESRDEIARVGNNQSVRDDREVGDALEDRVPDPDVLDPLSARPTALGEVLEGVQTDLDEVIDEGEEGSQREGGHEHRHETVLDHHLEVFVEEGEPGVRSEVVVLLPARVGFAEVVVVARSLVPPHAQDRPKYFDNVVEELLSQHDDDELDAQVEEAPGRVAHVVTSLCEYVPSDFYVSGVVQEATLKECDVDERSVVIDELENEHLESEGVLVLSLSPRNLQAGEPRNQLLVDEIEHDDEDEVDEGGGDGGGQLGVASDEVGVRLVDREADRYPVDDHAEDRSQHHEQHHEDDRIGGDVARDLVHEGHVRLGFVGHRVDPRRGDLLLVLGPQLLLLLVVLEVPLPLDHRLLPLP